MIEEWRVIEGYEGRYEVSNIGRVKNTKHPCKGDEPGIMKPFMTFGPSGEYLRLALKNPDGSQNKHPVHRLVAKAFIPNPENKPFINHKNGIRNDNRVINLEWCTASENAKHAIQTGRSRPVKGEHNASSKLTTPQVIDIKRQLSEGVLSMYRIAKNFGVHKVTIFDIKYGNTWKHIPNGTTQDH